jgi:hypothetical protein
MYEFESNSFLFYFNKILNLIQLNLNSNRNQIELKIQSNMKCPSLFSFEWNLIFPKSIKFFSSIDYR